MTQCSICLSNFRDPVCTPCGHVYCKRCLTDYANTPGNNDLSAKCPECRASFDLMIPDLMYLPEKYHKFVTHNVRRIYVDFSSINELRESLKVAEDRLAQKAATEQALLTRCEELTEALNAHRQGERDANQRILELQNDIANMEKLQVIHGLVLNKVTERGLEEGRAHMNTTKEEEKEIKGQNLLTVKIITDDTFSQHKTFDLAVFHDGNQPLSDIPTFRVPQYEPYNVFKSRVAKHFNYPQDQIRLWVLTNRQNKTVRPDTYVRGNQLLWTVKTIRNNLSRQQKDLLLYLDILPTPMKELLEDAGTALVFFKHFDTTKQTIVGIGKFHVPRAREAYVLIPIINEMMGWASGTPLKLYEEIKPGMTQLVKQNRTLEQNEIVDGDIVCFQSILSDREARDLESRGLHSNPRQFYDSLQNRMIKS